MIDEIMLEQNADGTARKTYYEKTIRKTTYRVTCEYLGKIDLQKALEELTVRKVLREIQGK